MSEQDGQNGQTGIKACVSWNPPVLQIRCRTLGELKLLDILPVGAVASHRGN
jgi:hypothetical protein